MNRLHGRLTYANVVATVALFIAIGGASAFAATQLAKNSVGTRQLKNGAVTAAKIKSGAITGAQINLATLGTVPSASRAKTATSAASATTAANASQLAGAPASVYLDKCPAGTSSASAGLCVTNNSIGSGDYLAALKDCGSRGWRLPSPAEAEVIFPKTPSTTVFWTDNYWVDSGGEEALYFSTEDESVFKAKTSETVSIFCVTTPSNS